jgi:hypothetical protein
MPDNRSSHALAVGKVTDKIWFKGKKTHHIIFTDEDIEVVLRALTTLGAGSFAKTLNEFDVAKARIYIQLRVEK